MSKSNELPAIKKAYDSSRLRRYGAISLAIVAPMLPVSFFNMKKESPQKAMSQLSQRLFTDGNFGQRTKTTEKR
jgi:hypothetical protein